MYGHCRVFQRSVCGHCTVTVRSLCKAREAVHVHHLSLVFQLSSASCIHACCFPRAVSPQLSYALSASNSPSSFCISIPPRSPRRRSCFNCLCARMSLIRPRLPAECDTNLVGKWYPPFGKCMPRNVIVKDACVGARSISMIAGASLSPSV